MNSKYCLHEYLNIFCVFIEAAGNSSLIDSAEFIVYKHPSLQRRQALIIAVRVRSPETWLDLTWLDNLRRREIEIELNIPNSRIVVPEYVV